MRRAFTVLLIALLIVPDAPAKGVRDWSNARKLKPGTSLEVVLQTGETVTGQLDGVTDTDLTLFTEDRGGPQSQWQRTMKRPEIQRITRYRRHEDLPRPEKWLAIGAASGAAVGVGIGIAQDSKKGTQGRFLLDGFAGGLLGFFGAVVVFTGIATARLVRHDGYAKLVYEAPPPQSSYPQQQFVSGGSLRIHEREGRLSAQ